MKSTLRLVLRRVGAILVGMLVVVLVGFSRGPSANSESEKKADHIEIHKAERTMTLLRGGKVLRTYKVALSTVPVGAKEREGDHKVTEGFYIVDAKNAHFGPSHFLFECVRPEARAQARR